MSQATALLDEQLEAWRQRPLGRSPYLWLDAHYEKVRQDGQVRDAAVLKAVGLNAEGRRQVLGVSDSLGEHEVHWRAFLQQLVARGLAGVELVISDAHPGLKQARRAVFGGVPWQRCQFHLQQNAQAYVPRQAMKAEVAADIRAVFNAAGRHEAEALLTRLVQKYAQKASQLAHWLETNIPEGADRFQLPTSPPAASTDGQRAGAPQPGSTSSLPRGGAVSQQSVLLVLGHRHRHGNQRRVGDWPHLPAAGQQLIVKVRGSEDSVFTERSLLYPSDLSIRRTLQELGVPRSTFYRWYQRYQSDGYEGLANQSHAARRFWNKIPQQVKDEVVELALAEPEKSPRELAWQFTDEHEYYISESSVYRILRQFDLVTSPVYQMIPAKDKFERPTRRINEMWQTDFTYFKVLGWGWYYLCTVLDDYSRYILAWRLAPTMAAMDVQETLDQAFARTNLTHIKVRHRPRLLSDNGPGFIADELKSYLQRIRVEHIRSAPYHPMTQGKIERFHRSMKNVIKLENYYLPWHLEQAIKEFVDYYNHQRYHESLGNVTPANMYHGRAQQIQSRRKQVKEKTMRERRRLNRHRSADPLLYGVESLS